MIDFSAARLSADEWLLIREAYTETYPVRPLLNHVDALTADLAAARERIAQLEGALIKITQVGPLGIDTYKACYEIMRGIACGALSSAAQPTKAGGEKL